MKTWNVRYLDGFSYLGRPTTQVRAVQAETKAAAAALCGSVQIVHIWVKKIEEEKAAGTRKQYLLVQRTQQGTNQ